MPPEDDNGDGENVAVALQTGQITITVGMGDDGSPRTNFKINGMGHAEAIGHLTTVLDLIKFVEISKWRTFVDPDVLGQIDPPDEDEPTDWEGSEDDPPDEPDGGDRWLEGDEDPDDG